MVHGKPTHTYYAGYFVNKQKDFVIVIKGVLECACMDENNITFWLSLLATLLSVLSFCGAVWRIWRDKPQLRFTASKVNWNIPKDNKTYNLVEIKVSNIGFRPIILTGFFALGRNTAFHMGDNDPTALAHGECIEAFPKILQAGETLKIYPMTIEMLQRNQQKQESSDHSVHKYKYFVFKDSFGRYYPMRVNDVLRSLHLLKAWKPTKGWAKILSWIDQQSCFRSAKKQGLLT